MQRNVKYVYREIGRKSGDVTLRICGIRYQNSQLYPLAVILPNTKAQPP